MLKSIVLKLKSEKELLIPHHFGVALHALFLETVKGIDRECSEKLHNFKENKPYTVSKLFGENIDVAYRIKEINKDQFYYWKITSLESELSAFLEQKFLQGLPERLKVAGTEFSISEINKHPYAISMSHKELYEAYFTEDQYDQSYLEFVFITPTAFKSDKKNLPFPLPRSIFLSCMNKWNSFSEVHVGDEETLNLIDSNLSVIKHNIRTSSSFIKANAKFTGFTGNVTLKIKKNAPEHIRKIINMLADYALFCSTGYKTALTYGQTVRTNSKFLFKENKINELCSNFNSGRQS